MWDLKFIANLLLLSIAIISVILMINMIPKSIIKKKSKSITQSLLEPNFLLKMAHQGLKNNGNYWIIFRYHPGPLPGNYKVVHDKNANMNLTNNRDRLKFVEYFDQKGFNYLVEQESENLVHLYLSKDGNPKLKVKKKFINDVPPVA